MQDKEVLETQPDIQGIFILSILSYLSSQK